MREMARLMFFVLVNVALARSTKLFCIGEPRAGSKVLTLCKRHQIEGE
jgi:hypothetical protein